MSKRIQKIEREQLATNHACYKGIATAIRQYGYEFVVLAPDMDALRYAWETLGPTAPLKEDMAKQSAIISDSTLDLLRLQLGKKSD